MLYLFLLWHQGLFQPDKKGKMYQIVGLYSLGVGYGDLVNIGLSESFLCQFSYESCEVLCSWSCSVVIMEHSVA